MEVENWNLVGKAIYNVEIINMCFITGAMNLANKMQILSDQHVKCIYTQTHIESNRFGQTVCKYINRDEGKEIIEHNELSQYSTNVATSSVSSLSEKLSTMRHS